jgi:hypothetical protein
MSNTLSALESSRASLMQQISQLGDMRPGSVTTVFRRCGKPTCHCARANDPGHGPHFQLTCKQEGKTVTQSLPNLAVVKKVEQEIAEFRNFEKLSQALVAVNQKICQLRPLTEPATPWTPEEKKRLMRSIKRLQAR